MIAKKVDNQQQQIVAELRKHDGVTVQVLSTVGKGCPDIIVGYRGRNYFFEIKAPKTGKLTQAQQEWHSVWTGQVDVITSVQEAFLILH